MCGNRCGHCAAHCVQKICLQDCKDGKISGPYLYHKCEYCVQDTVLVQSWYSPGTVLVQSWYSPDTVRVQSGTVGF